MAATMRDVALRAGVSMKTVSNYFNGYPYMRPETRSRIEVAIDELKYKMNVSARNLRSGKTRTIALAIPELDQAYFAELAQAVISAAQQRGLTVIIETTEGDRDHERSILEGAQGRSVDGLIFGPLALGTPDLEGVSVDIPMVLIGDRVHGGRFDHVAMANTEGARAATQHLLRSGRRRIVALGEDRTGAAGPSAPTLRTAGFLAAHEAAGVEPDPDLMIGPLAWHRPAGATAIADLLHRGVTFDAVFGYNDALALGAMRELLRNGIRVPDDVAVVGFDDTEDAVFATPSLTTVNPGRDWIANRAVELLQMRMSPAGAESAPQTVVAEHSLVIRESTN